MKTFYFQIIGDEKTLCAVDNTTYQKARKEYKEHFDCSDNEIKERRTCLAGDCNNIYKSFI